MQKAVFTHGSPTKHILVMTGANAVGLVTLFTEDLVDMYFLSLLGQKELAAAIGFSGTLLFFLTAVSIGLQIAMDALVARAEGAHNRQRAGDYCTNVLVFGGLVSVLVSFPAWLYQHKLPLFWRFHKVHHADRDFDVTTGVRFYPVEIVLSMLFKICGIALFRRCYKRYSFSW